MPRINGNVLIDGVLDEKSWDDALLVELKYENDPGENTKAPVETIAYLAEDGENLYVAFKAYDPEPGKIRAWLRDRDSLGSNDFVGVSFDTYDDGRRAFEFFVNPLGVQLDKTHDDVIRRGDKSWDAIWESAGKIGDEGYVVEMRIPLDQLRFQSIEGNQTWKYRVVRSYPREQNFWLSNSSRDRNRNCSICQYSRFEGLEGSRSGSDIEVVPTLTASTSSSTDEPGVIPLDGGDFESEAGLTIRYGITPEMTANLAINPDFSQVEADNAQLDINNRFTLSYPEKRPFFLEGADYFSTPFQAVFTRTVVNPEVAAKFIGKRGANTIAAFAARDHITNLLFPGATGSDSTSLEQGNIAFVGRYIRSVAGTSSFGSMLTVRDGDDYKNFVGGFDGRWRINDHHEVSGQVLHSETEYPFDVALEFDQPIDKFGGDAVLVSYQYNSRNWNGKIAYQKIGDYFRADSGFMRRGGMQEQRVSLGRRWFGSDSSWWTRMRLDAVYERKFGENGELLEDDYSAAFAMSGPLQSFARVNFRTGREFEAGQLFAVDRLSVHGEFQPLGGLEMGLNSEISNEIDYVNTRLGDRRRFSPFLKWSVNRHLRVRLNGSLDEFESKEGENIYDASLMDARVTWQFNIRSSLRLTIQQSDIERNQLAYIEPIDTLSSNTGRQMLYSWKMNPQTVFFLGYSDTYVEDDEIMESTVSDRSWFMKIGYVWSI